MAGVARPNTNMVEATYTRVAGALYAGDGSALLDGNTDVTSSYHYGYFYDVSNYITLDVTTVFQLWAFPNVTYPNHTSALRIMKLAADGVTWTDVAGSLPRSNKPGVWALTTPILAPGRYKFSRGSNERIDNEWFLELPTDTKTLVEAENGTLYGLSGTAFVSVGTAPCTAEHLDSFGVSAAAWVAVPSAAWDGLPAGQLVLHHTSSADDVTVTGSIVTQPRIVVQNKAYEMADWSSVTGISLTVQESGGGIVRAVVSVDNGTTWKTWKSSMWQPLDIADPAVFASGGMSASTLNALTAANWAALFPVTPFGLRFAYLLDRVTSSGTAAVDTLTISGNVKGSWLQDYGAKVGWLEGGARVQITAAGSYKINWPAL